MVMSFEDLTSNTSFTRNVKGKVTLLPDPPRAERRYLMISCDDHIVEPPTMFDNHASVQHKHLMPELRSDENGVEYWLYEGRRAATTRGTAGELIELVEVGR